MNRLKFWTDSVELFFNSISDNIHVSSITAWPDTLTHIQLDIFTIWHMKWTTFFYISNLCMPNYSHRQKYPNFPPPRFFERKNLWICVNFLSSYFLYACRKHTHSLYWISSMHSQSSNNYRSRDNCNRALSVTTININRSYRIMNQTKKKTKNEKQIFSNYS